MTQAFYALAILACPIGMVLMMWFMMRSGKQTAQTTPPAQPSASHTELAALRAEVDQLHAAQRENRGQAGVRLSGTEPQ